MTAPAHAAVIQTDTGLGDNLLYSTLPELYAARAVPVFIHAESREGPKAYRNDEIYELVWGRNPFVAGVSGAPANAGDFTVRTTPRDVRSELGPIGLIERAHGFAGTGLWPKIYYEPRPDLRFAGKVLIDLSSSSVPFVLHPETLIAYVRYLLAKYGYRLEDCLGVEFARTVSLRTMTIHGIAVATIESIYAYCDAIASAEALITVESGAQMLASAVKRDRARPLIFALFSTRGLNEGQFLMPNVRYLATGAVDVGGEFPA